MSFYYFIFICLVYFLRVCEKSRWDLSKKELRRINRETARKQNANFGGNEAQFDSDSDSDEDGDDDGAADEGDHSKK